MRNLPVALATLGDDAAVRGGGLAQAHHAPPPAVGRRGAGHRPPAAPATGRRRRLGDGRVASTPGSPRTGLPLPPYPGRASGYVVDTVQTVLHCFCAHADFEAAVVAAVNQGDDADTTGALVGMLAGARCGARGLPRRWLRRLDSATRHAITEQTGALLAAAGTPPPTLP
jgi:ADP-ribosyl-[dinitrogen reductase] hydrolase